MESSEEKKNIQGQGSSSGSCSQTSHEQINESLDDLAR